MLTNQHLLTRLLSLYSSLFQWKRLEISAKAGLNCLPGVLTISYKAKWLMAGDSFINNDIG